MLTLPDLLNILYCLRHYLCLGSDGSDKTVRTDRTVKEWLIITSSLSGVLTPMALKGLCVWEWLCESSSVTICGVSAPMALTGRVGLCCREREREYQLVTTCVLSSSDTAHSQSVQDQHIVFRLRFWLNIGTIGHCIGQWWLCGMWYMICNTK